MVGMTQNMSEGSVSAYFAEPEDSVGGGGKINNSDNVRETMRFGHI